MREPSQPSHLDYEPRAGPRSRWWWRFVWSPTAPWLWVKAAFLLVVIAFLLWLIVSTAVFAWYLGPVR